MCARHNLPGHGTVNGGHMTHSMQGSLVGVAGRSAMKGLLLAALALGQGCASSGDGNPRLTDGEVVSPDAGGSAGAGGAGGAGGQAGNSMPADGGGQMGDDAGNQPPADAGNQPASDAGNQVFPDGGGPGTVLP